MNYKILHQNKIAIITIDGNIDREDKVSISSCSKELLEKVNVDPLVFRDLT